MNDMLKKEAVQNMRKNPCSRARENEYWTEEELERLKTMFDDGEDFTDIAFVLQRSEPAVMQQVLRHESVFPEAAPRKKAKRAGVQLSLRTVQQRSDDLPIPLTLKKTTQEKEKEACLKNIRTFFPRAKRWKLCASEKTRYIGS